jgi:hypothetical protein
MSETGHATGMAGEFHAMEILHRLGHQPALTLGNAKTIDIISKAPSGNIYEVSVKAIRGGGKWGIGKDDYSKSENLVFMLFWYKDFGNIEAHPETWIIPATEAEAIKRPWHNQFGLYLYKEYAHLLDPYKSAWKYLA